MLHLLRPTRTLAAFAALAAPFALAACPAEPEGEEVPLDSDSDGLADAQEAELGTDPDEADTDGDGHDDGAEVTAGTNPLNPWHFEYTGGYVLNDFEASDVPDASGPSDQVGTSFLNRRDIYGAGDVPEDFAFTDQYGDTVHLYSFFGQHIMLAVGAEWCGPCRAMAELAQGEQDHYGPMGFQLIELLQQDAVYNPADAATAERWADDFGLITVPSLAGGEFDPNGWWERDNLIPSVIHIGPDMRIISMDEGIRDPAEYFDE
jgi:thiol-disulfide isomerase/thioredoxin